MDMMFNQICEAISSIRVTYVGMEYDLQAIVAAALKDAGVPFQKEYQLGHGSRVDFFVDGAVDILKRNDEVLLGNSIVLMDNDYVIQTAEEFKIYEKYRNVVGLIALFGLIDSLISIIVVCFHLFH